MFKIEITNNKTNEKKCSLFTIFHDLDQKNDSMLIAIKEILEKINNSYEYLYTHHGSVSEISDELSVFLISLHQRTRFVNYILFDNNNNRNSFITDLQNIERGLDVLKNDFCKLSDNTILSNKNSEYLPNISTDIIELNKILDILYMKSLSHFDGTFRAAYLQLLEIEKSSNRFLADQNSWQNRISKFQIKLSELEADETKLRSEIENRFTDTEKYLNQQGLSKSFHDKSTDLLTTSRIWLGALIISIVVILGFTYYHIPSNLINESISINQVQTILWSYLIYSPIAFVSFWAIWFCSRNYFYYVRLKENYNFKNALSKAYYGYKNESRVLDKELSTTILKGVIDNICKNPAESSNSQYNSPWTEILSSSKEIIKKAEK